MGWNRSKLPNSKVVFPSIDSSPDKVSVQHVEDVKAVLHPHQWVVRSEKYPDHHALAIASNGAPLPRVDLEGDLPVFSAEEVRHHDGVRDEELWIVIEDKVYDCTHFAKLHPGGESMILQFAGKSCTWQFWKFHNRRILKEWSTALLIGKVQGDVPNPYKQPPRWINTS